MDIKLQKKSLRIEMLQKRQALESSYKKDYDLEICKRLEKRILTNKYQTVHAYIPMANEIDITTLILQLLKQNIQVICPKTLPKRQLENRVLRSLDELETGIMGTQHPAKPEVYEGSYDLILVPGLAFDSDNFRLGYGGGYYDGFLVSNPQTQTLGLFYPFQKIAQTPRESHDIQLKEIMVV